MNNIDWKNPFKPKDFYQIDVRPHGDIYCNLTVTCENASALANLRFRELVEQCPKMNLVHEFGQWSEQNYKFYLEPTHTARLICIERVKK